MRVGEIWRYPVKSMGGERLDETEVGVDGIPGDRVVQARDGRGRRLTARTHWPLLGFHATLDPSGVPLIDGRPWDDPATAAAVRKAVGESATLVRDESRDRFDVLPLLVATDGAITALGVDRRRLRPNLVIDGVEGLAERDWPGRRLRIGDVLISVAKLRGRCVMTTYDPDTLAQDAGVLRRIVREFDGRMALDCAVVEPGSIRVGDAVELL
jgi:uncharacterized protein YcbX